MILRSALTALLLLPLAAPAAAAPRQRIDVPAGPLAISVATLGRQAGISVSVADAALWQRRVPAVRGHMPAAQALARLLSGSGARAVALGQGSWRIVAAPSASPSRRAAPAIPPPPLVEEQPIIVTGSKRDTRFDEFPGTVTLLEGEDLAFGGEGGTDAVLSRLATVSSTHLGAGRNKLFIRGIADSSFTGPTQATVGQYLGDIRLTYNAPDPDLRLYDIATVEVLEGPQGTLYGAGSLGGIIRIVRNPARVDAVEAGLSAGASLTAHGDPGGDIGAMVNLPLLRGSVGLRAVGYGVTEGGYIDNLATGEKDVNRSTIAGGRAALRLEPGDGWTVDLGGTLQDTDGDDSQYADRDGPRLSRRSRIDQGFEARYRLGELAIGKQWDGLRFLSSTGIVRQRLAERYDATGADDVPRLFRQQNRTALFSSENRLWRPMRDGYGWVLGASYVRNRTRLTRALGDLDAPVPVTGVTNRIRETTVYGEGSVQLLPGLTATAGARYTRARLSGDGQDVARAIALAGAQITADRREEALLPSFALSATVLPRFLLYARYQEGFRPGGLAIESAFVRRFRNDRVATLESGARYGAPGRDPLFLSASMSYTRWRHIQADFVDESGLPTTDNIGDGRIYSFAASAGVEPLPGLTLDAAFAHNNSRVTEPDPVYFLALARMSRIPNVAKTTVRVAADYQAPLGDRFDLRIGGWVRYVGKSRLGIGPVLGDAQGDYLDTALNLRVGTLRWGVTLGLTNLTDSVGNRFALGTPFGGGQPAQITPLRPRTLRIGVDASF